MRLNNPKAMISTATIVDPTGVPAMIELKIPIVAQKVDKSAEHMVTDLKLLNKRIEDKAGKITNAEISKEPTKFMARTIITAIITAIIRLYALAFMPVDVAKVSSKVTAKILL